MGSRIISVLAGRGPESPRYESNHIVATLDRLRSRLRWAVVVFSVVACGVLVAFSATSSSAADGKQTLAGAWNVAIDFDDPGLVDCTAPSLNTSDGGVVAQGCDLGESPGYGQWRRTGNGEFAATFSGVNYGAPGTGITGSYKVRGTLQASGATFIGPFVADIFALDGTLLFSASGTVTLNPIEVEPL